MMFLFDMYQIKVILLQMNNPLQPHIHQVNGFMIEAQNKQMIRF